MQQIELKGMAWIVYVPGEEKYYLCATGDNTFVRVEVNGVTLCRLAAESAHYLTRFIPGAYAYTPKEIHQ